MSSPSIEKLMRDAEALAAEIEQSLSTSHGPAFDQFPQLSSQQQDYIMRQAQSLVDQDLQDIEHQLRQEQRREEIPAQASPLPSLRGKAVKNHNMI